MRIIGLTGSIGMGKSTATMMVRRLGIPVHDSDATVHRVMAPGGVCFDTISKAFPAVIRNGLIDRKSLGADVFADPEARKRLEAIVHPAVRAAERTFLNIASRHSRPTVVLDVPLLFETGGDARCDGVIVVSAPKWLQRRRVLGRLGVTEDRFRGILQAQMTDLEKRNRADFVLHSGLGKTITYLELKNIFTHINDIPASVWPNRYRCIR